MEIIENIKSALASAGYMTNDLMATKIYLLLCQTIGTKAMILDGPPGTGKTALAKAVAKILGTEYIYMACTPGTTPEDVLYDVNIVNILKSAAGNKKAVETDEDVIKYGFLPTIFEKSQHEKVVAFVDELDKSDPQTDSLFLSALEEGEVLIAGKRIKCKKENLILFFTKNNERDVSEPLMRRCRREYMQYLEPTLEVNVLTGKVNTDNTVKIIEFPHGEELEISQDLAIALVKVANVIRSTEYITKAPATQELMLAGQDIERLKQNNLNQYIWQIAKLWLFAYKEDENLLEENKQMEEIKNIISFSSKSIMSSCEEIIDSEFLPRI